MSVAVVRTYGGNCQMYINVRGILSPAELALERGHCDLATLAIPVSAAAVTSLFNQKYDVMFLKLHFI